MAIIPYTHGTSEWHALRAENVGASEVAALCDVQPAYAASRYELWMVKAGRAAPREVDNPRVDWGLRLEAAIAEGAADERGWPLRKGGYARSPDCPGLGASLDYEVDPTPEDLAEGRTGPGVLEVKNADWLVHVRQWADDQAPPHILLQLQAQLLASGYGWGAIACLVGGNNLKIHTYQARPRLFARITHEVETFWQSVRANRPPPVDGSEGARSAIERMFPMSKSYDPVDLTGDNELPGECAELIQARADKKENDARIDRLVNSIMAKAGSNRHAVTQGFNITISTTDAKAERPAPPDYVIPGRAESRRLIVKERRAA